LDIVDFIILKEVELAHKESCLLFDIINVDHSYVCAVCGKAIDRIAAQRKTRDVLWHDRKCYEEKPRKIIHLERIYNKKIEDILIATTRQCMDIKSQCSILNISIPYLYHIIRKYCGEEYIEFMQKYSVGKRKELYTKKCNIKSLGVPDG
jgi:hypothetical protein